MSINEGKEEKQRNGGKVRTEETNEEKCRDVSNVKGRIINSNVKKENCSRVEVGGRSKYRCTKCGGKSPAHVDKRSPSPSEFDCMASLRMTYSAYQDSSGKITGFPFSMALLGKQRKYLEAEEVKKSADKMEQAKMQETIAAFQSEVAVKAQVLLSKQQNETDILLQRAARTRDEIRMAKEVDLQQCHQRHKNVIRELMALQRQECLRFDQLMQKKLQHYKASGGNIHKLSQATGLSGLPSMMDPCAEEGCI